MTNNFYPIQGRFTSATAHALRVFPVCPFGKNPALPWTKYRDAPADRAELERWDASDFNVGVITGAASGVFVVDADNDDALALLDTLDLPRTPTVKTGRGKHYYFKMPAVPLRNSTFIGGHKLDVRGEGGYVVGAGSVHPSGAMYTWEVSPEEVPFAEVPPALLELLKGRRNEPSKSGGARRDTAPGLGRFSKVLEESLEAALQPVREAKEGERNDILFKAAVQLANDVAAAEADWRPFAEALSLAAISAGLPPGETAGTLASAWKSGSLRPTAWIRAAQDWIYLVKRDAFYHRQSREYVNVVSFNSKHLAAWQGKGSFNRYLLSNGLVEVCHDLDFVPGREGGVLERDGLRWFNTYRPSQVEAVPGDASRFAGFLAYLFPTECERSHVTKYIAWSIRNPGVRIRHALMIRTAAQGVGKTLLVETWGKLLGRHNVRKTTTEEIMGPFQGYLPQRLLIVVEELNFGVGPSGYNRLKDPIANDVVSVNEKNLPVREWDNTANWLILTNIEVPILIEQNDRRFFFVDSPATPRGSEYYGGLVAWLDANLGVVRTFFDEVDLSDFDPHAHPPMTVAKQALIADSRTELHRELVHALEERKGKFDRDLLTLEEIEYELGYPARQKGRTALRRALEKVGAVKLGQVRIGPGPHERPSLWAVRNVSYWLRCTPASRADEYRRTSGIFAAMDGIVTVGHLSELEGLDGGSLLAP